MHNFFVTRFSLEEINSDSIEHIIKWLDRSSLINFTSISKQFYKFRYYLFNNFYFNYRYICFCKEQNSFLDFCKKIKKINRVSNDSFTEYFINLRGIKFYDDYNGNFPRLLLKNIKEMTIIASRSGSAMDISEIYLPPTLKKLKIEGMMNPFSKKIIFPDSIEELSIYNFFDWKNIKMPKSLQTITLVNNWFAQIEDLNFFHCLNLKQVKIFGHQISKIFIQNLPKNSIRVLELYGIVNDNLQLDQCKILENLYIYWLTENLYFEEFNLPVSLQRLNFGNSVKKINDDWLFNLNNLKFLTFSNRYTHSFKKLKLPPNLEYIFCENSMSRMNEFNIKRPTYINNRLFYPKLKILTNLRIVAECEYKMIIDPSRNITRKLYLPLFLSLISFSLFQITVRYKSHTFVPNLVMIIFYIVMGTVGAYYDLYNIHIKN